MAKGPSKQTKPRRPPRTKRLEVEPPAGEFLLEVGTEELPYQFIPPALRALAESAERLFKEHRLAHGALRTFGTPRRLVLAADSLASRQASVIREVMGPPRAVAFDSAGQPTKAAVGFAASHSVGVADLASRQTSKGEYVFVVKEEPGRMTSAVLPEVLPLLIGSLSFPKSMRWNQTGMRFARPIRWLLALYGRKVVDLRVGGVAAGNRTWGHRFPAASNVKQTHGLQVNDLKSYLKQLERHGVIPEQEHRRTMILVQCTTLSKTVRGHLHRDEDLLEQAVYTVEYPHAILGSFNPQYLCLPKEVLMTAMKEHQGYFSLIGQDGQLLPHFISVTNVKLPNMRLIREGNERVLAARLADAKFFFDEDRKIKLQDRVEKLKGVIFHEKLGTLFQKQERMVHLAGRLASWLSLPREVVEASKRAAELSKADLLTGMVGEFPMLQGVMGREYARQDGESEAVCVAIGEHYLPRTPEDELPATPAGQVLSLADRLDTIVAFFCAGILPTGSEDPFALRRQALGVVRIILEKKLLLDLRRAILELTDEFFRGQAAGKWGEGNDPFQFILDRLRYYGRTVHDLRDDVIEAVIKSLRPAAEVNLLDLFARMQALQSITVQPEFDPLMVGFTRVHRLVEKEKWDKEAIDPGLFQHPSEENLYKVLVEARQVVPAAITQRDYATALGALVRMKPMIDDFFLGVLVNTEEQGLRSNRLSLLYAVDQLFLSFADFSQIVAQGRSRLEPA